MNHRQSRAATRRLVDLASQYHPWTDEDRRVLDETSAAYSTLLRRHMSKEDEFLYPMVIRRLPLELNGIAQGFARFRAHETGADEYRRLLILGQSLVQRHGPSDAEPLQPSEFAPTIALPGQARR